MSRSAAQGCRVPAYACCTKLPRGGNRRIADGMVWLAENLASAPCVPVGPFDTKGIR